MEEEIVGAEDAAWLDMDGPESPMVVDAVVELADPLPRERAMELAARIAALPRFRSRVVTRGRFAAPVWAPDPAFRLEDHVAHVALESASDEALRSFIGEIVSDRLPASRPLWQVTFVERPQAGTILLLRVHHALADGFALLGLLARLADEGEARASVPPTRARGLTGESGLTGRAVRGSVTALRRLVTSPRDSMTLLKRSPGTDKRVAWSRPIPLARVKASARALSATVNDVLVAVVAGALARTLARRGDETASARVHAMMPVNLRADGAPVGLGNRIGLVIAELPLDIRDPMARVHAVHERMVAMKHSPEAQVARVLMVAMGLLPRRFERLAMSFFADKTSLVLTNVPGPARSLSLSGSRIARMMFWVPQAARLGLGVSIFSYAGFVTIGVLADAHVLPEPDTLVEDLHAELDSLEACLSS